MAKKIAGSGLNYSHLKCVYDTRGGLDGLTTLLSEKGNGKIRVAKVPKILQTIAGY